MDRDVLEARRVLASEVAGKIRTGADGGPLAPGEELLLLLIADHVSARERRAWPSIRTLARETHLGERRFSASSPARRRPGRPPQRAADGRLHRRDVPAIGP